MQGRDRAHEHAAAKRGHRLFFFGPRKRGVRPHPPNPPWLRACGHHDDFSKWAKKRPAIHPLARPRTRSFCTFRNLSFDRSTTEDKLLYLTSVTGKKSSQSQRKGHCQLLPKDSGKQHLTLRPATHLPRCNHRLLWAAIMHTSNCTGPNCIAPQLFWQLPRLIEKLHSDVTGNNFLTDWAYRALASDTHFVFVWNLFSGCVTTDKGQNDYPIPFNT